MRSWEEIAEVVRARQESLMRTRAELIRLSGVSGRTWDDLLLRAKPLVRTDVKRNAAGALDWVPEAFDQLLAGADPDALAIPLGGLDLTAPSDIERLDARLADLEARVEILETTEQRGAVLRMRPAAKRRPKMEDDL